MKIPKTLKVSAHQIDVQKREDVEINNSGYFDSMHYAIRIRNCGPETRQSEAFLHEIMESISFMHNMSIDHKDLTTMSEVLFQVLRDNKLRFDEP